MIRLRKVLVVLCVVLVAGSLLAGCSKKEEKKEEPKQTNLVKIECENGIPLMNETFSYLKEYYGLTDEVARATYIIPKGIDPRIIGKDKNNVKVGMSMFELNQTNTQKIGDSIVLSGVTETRNQDGKRKLYSVAVNGQDNVAKIYILVKELEDFTTKTEIDQIKKMIAEEEKKAADPNSTVAPNATANPNSTTKPEESAEKTPATKANEEIVTE